MRSITTRCGPRSRSSGSNCAALSDQLLESELFGHDKGAFTGAGEHRLGRFEQADGGSLFLDEIGEISAPFQAKLLRVLQEGEFERVGSSKTRVGRHSDHRRDQPQPRGRRRRWKVPRGPVLPAQRDADLHAAATGATEDLPDIARFLTSRIAQRQGRPLEVTDCAIRLMMQYDWPGNIREVENCLERGAIMADNGVIDRESLSLTGLEDRILSNGGNLSRPPANFNDPELDERERIIAALEHAGWVQAKAARLLGMTPRQIAYRIQQFNIKMRKI